MMIKRGEVIIVCYPSNLPPRNLITYLCYLYKKKLKYLSAANPVTWLYSHKQIKVNIPWNFIINEVTTKATLNPIEYIKIRQLILINFISALHSPQSLYQARKKKATHRKKKASVLYTPNITQMFISFRCNIFYYLNFFICTFMGKSAPWLPYNFLSNVVVARW